MYAFDYHKATDVAQARAALAADGEAKLLAGGMTLLPSMKHRLAAPSRLIDIGKLPELRGMAVNAASVTIGAAMRHCEVADSADVRRAIAALATLAGLIGDAQVRARGTIGGSLANNDPAADYPAAVLGLDGVVVTDRREIAAVDFFHGMFTTALATDEIIKAVRFAIPRRAAYAKFAHPASGYAMTGVMVADYGNSIRVAVTGAGSSVFRWSQAEAALSQSFSESSLTALSYPADGLNADLHAPAQYRAHLISVMTRQAVRALSR